MKHRIHSIKFKLTLLLVGSIALILLLVGIPMGNLLEHLYKDEANRSFERVVRDLGQQLRHSETSLANHVQRLAARDDLVASLNMIAQYARADDYQALIFDTEKRLLLSELRKEVEAGDADEILAYDAAGRLLAFVSSKRENLSGHLSYLQNQPVYQLSREPYLVWERQSLPAYIDARIDTEQLDRRLFRGTDGLVIQGRAPVLRHYPDGSHRVLGMLVVNRTLGEDFVTELAAQTGIAAGLSFDNGLQLGKSLPFQVAPEALAPISVLAEPLSYARLDHAEHYLAVLRLSLEDSGHADWIFSLPTATVQAAIGESRQLLLMILLLASGLILPLALWLTNRVVSRPLHELSHAVERLRQGERGISLAVHSGDELGRLSRAFNEMSVAIEQRQHELEESRSHYRTLVDNLPQRIYYKDHHSVYLSCNQRYAEDLGLQVEGIIGKRDDELYPEAIARQMHQDDERIMALGQLVEREEVYPLNGESLLVHTVKLPLYDHQGRCSGILGIFWDVTAQKQAESRLRQSATVFENTADGVIVTDLQSRIIAVNKAFCEITGYSEEEVLGKNPSFRRSERQDKPFYEAMWQEINAHGRWQGEIWNRRKSGEIYPEWITISAVRDSHGQLSNYVAVFSDITQIKRSQMQLDHMANHDPLTDLPNRTLLDDRLRQAILRAGHAGRELAVLFIDLDRFKNVNDTLGHPTGDLLLREVAQRLQALLRSQETVARLGGDEFIILIEQMDRPELPEFVASKVIEAMSIPFHLNGKEFYIGASIGISIYPEDGQDASTLIKHADAAMYRAKEEGRNTYQFYTRELSELAAERLLLESALRRAMERGELQVFYQPKVELHTGRVVAAEALLRWEHPEMGFIAPDRFISLAEENGQILPIGEWVLNEACARAAEWVGDFPFFGHVAVNLSVVQIQRGDMITRVREALRVNSLNAAHLHLEITESVLMQYPELAAQVLEGLRDLGVALAVDDFGTGYSSLSYLKKFPIHTLKIDRSFVTDIPGDVNDAAITRAVIALGKSLQLQIVAEGVETAEQQAFLLQEGCDLGQGYYYSRPVPAEAFTEMLRKAILPERVARGHG